jgi:tetratricopeptide (TPR) repeat protein
MADSTQSGCKHQGELLRDKKVCVTGRLVSMTHAQFANLVRELGGRFLSYPNRGGLLLVVGEDGWPTERDASPTRIFQRARMLKVCGYAIEFLSEEQFFDRLGLVEHNRTITSLHTVADLTGVLNVSAARIRKWIRLGLVQPVETIHRLDFFDFRQVANAKRLQELLDEGVSLTRIRRGLEQLGELMHVGSAFDQLSLLEHDGRLVCRLNGQLVEPRGQRLLDFGDGEDGEAEAVIFPGGAEQTEDLFGQALSLEDAGRLEEAARAYRQAIALEPVDPVLHFNLGNVLFALGSIEESVDAFRQAVLCDPYYAESWNNLGNAYAELGSWEQAADALQKAVTFVPGYADAHYNLADVLKRLGRSAEAAQHWSKYESLRSVR